MIPSSASFESNRQALSNVATYKVYLSLPNLAYSVIPTASSSFGAKYPIQAITNGNRTHKNDGLDVGDSGYDPLFPAMNVWQSNGEANPYFYVDLGDCYLINKIKIKLENRTFFPDIVIDKTIIECYGDYWHCNPEKYDENYKHTKINKTAKEIWETDVKRKNILENAGYKYLVVWEKEWNTDKENTLKKIINEL